MKRITLLNPNTTEALTKLMVEIARERAPADVRIDAATVTFGPSLITCDEEMDEAARAVCALAPELSRRADAVIVSAFGDPGADELAELLDQPVVGIAEAAMRAAALGGRPFGVVTHTPALVQRMTKRAQAIGLGNQCVGVFATEGDPATLMIAPAVLEMALQTRAEMAVERHGAEAIIVGGGPLGRFGQAIARTLRVPVIEPIPEAVRHVAAALGIPATR